MSNKIRKKYAKSLLRKTIHLENNHRVIFSQLFSKFEQKILRNGLYSLTLSDIQAFEDIIKEYFLDLGDMAVNAANAELKILAAGKIKYQATTLPGLSISATNEARVIANKKISDYRQMLIKYINKLPFDADKAILKETVNKATRVYKNTHIEAVLRTKSTDIVNERRLELFRQSSIVSGLQFLAVNDDRVTDICINRHLHILSFNSPELGAYTPPLHFRCRSILSPVTIFENLEHTGGERLRDTVDKFPADFA